MEALRRSKAARLGAAILVAALIAVIPVIPAAARGKGPSRDWKRAAKKLRSAALAEAKADWLLAQARLYAMEPGTGRDDAADTAREDFAESKGLAKEQYAARLDLARALGEDGLYRVEIDPADFVEGVDNPFFPLAPGSRRVYESETEAGTERIEIDVLEETREILGVTCVVVHDFVSVEGTVVEDTHDYYAQDKLGNVWYFGEVALNYEDGRLTDVEGSWEAGADGAQPGIIMRAAPAVGDVYRQEFLLGAAEDYAEVLATGESVTVPAGTFEGCLRTKDGTPIEPDGIEHKSYAPGIGVVLEVTPETGERVELTEYSD